MAIEKKVTFEGNTYNLGTLERVAASTALQSNELGTNRYLRHVAYIDNTTAFVRNSDSEATWTQPANTVITGIHLFFPSETYSTGTGNNLGYEVGTASGGGQIVAGIVDQIIDAGADGTDLAQGAFLTVATIINGTESATTLGASAAYSGTSTRTVYLNTTCDNAAAVTTAGTVRWIVEYVVVA
tara:strand:- start:1078 stop:1629 length:552 start_codon:yes stop_codon:yes gene_type:complete